MTDARMLRINDMLEHMKNDYKAWADRGPDPHGHRASMYEDFCNSLDYTIGKKYIKVIQEDSSVHAFIDRKTGDVYKPASWKAPAKHVRFNLFNDNDRSKLHDYRFTDWAGGYLYLR